jgi:hypothetical protein
LSEIQEETIDIAQVFAEQFLQLMDKSPGVVNMLGVEFLDKNTGRKVQVTMEYIKPGVKSPTLIMSELRAENEELKSRMAKIANIESI